MSELKVSVIGAGGHARSVISLLHRNEIKVNAVYDNSFTGDIEEHVLEVPLLGKMEDVPADEVVVLAIGDCNVRAKWFMQLKNQIHKENIFHPIAFKESHTKFGVSNLIFAKAYLNAETEIGDNNILNTACIVEHECSIGSHNHISIGAALGGRVTVGDCCFIGAGAIVKDGIYITDKVTIGAGCVVVKDIEMQGVYVGNPAKRIK